MSNNHREDSDPKIQQDILKGLSVGRDVTTGDITQQYVHTQHIVHNHLIVSNSQVTESSNLNFSIDELVQQVRVRIEAEIQERCGTMRILDMTQPIGLDEIYTDVNILEKITGRRRLSIDELMRQFDPDSEDFERYGLGKVTEQRVPGVDAVSRLPKLMILGKPGAGKTTFLKYLAIQCICGGFQSDRIPVFITLKQFAEINAKPHLLNFIERHFSKFGVLNGQVETLLENGRFLILLDGLDEVREEDTSRIINQIIEFSKNFFYSNLFQEDLNYFIDSILSKFTSVLESLKLKSTKDLIRTAKEPFLISILKGLPQKHGLIKKVEGLVGNTLDRFLRELIDEKNQDSDKSKSSNINERFRSSLSTELKSINRHEYLQFFCSNQPEKLYSNHFVITCRIAAREEKFEQFTEVEVADFDDLQIQSFINKWFREKQPNPSKPFIKHLKSTPTIRDLAANPLLLTLLCLVFQETFDFPSNRSELYREGISILLKKWDAERLIKRDNLYKNLSSLRKEDLLSQIALTTFNRKEYFFKQKDLEQNIADYICNLPDAKTDTESLQFDSEVVLKSIEAQHGLLVERAKGIYSFSHLTFQEYFTARRIVTTSNPKNLEMALQDLSSHISEKRWREVFLLAVGMLPDADRLLQLMKQDIDKTVRSNEELQQFLTWIHQKSLEFKSLYRPEAIRAFYLANALRTDHSSSIALKKLLDQIVDYADNHAFAPQLIHSLKQAKGLILDLHLNYKDERSEQVHFFIAYTLDENLKFQCLLNSVEKISEQLPSGKGEGRKFRDWWRINSKSWARSFSTTVALHRSIDQSLQVDEQFQKIAHIYYEANKLLIECLNSDCYVSREVRQEIEKTLLLPQSLKAD